MHRFVNRSKTQHLQELHEPAGPPEQEKPVVDGRCWIQAHECHSQRVFSDKVNYTTSSLRHSTLETKGSYSASG
jgi:hypothetical protein